MVFVIFDKFITFVITSFFGPSLNTLMENGPKDHLEDNNIVPPKIEMVDDTDSLRIQLTLPLF